jgi:hypothetical protein
VGFESNHKKTEVNVILKERVKKKFWFYKRKKYYMENQNKRGIRWINKDMTT